MTDLASLQQLLGAGAENDPTTQALMQFLAQRQAEQASSPEENAREAELTELELRLNETQQRAQELADLSQGLYAELETLRTREGELAAAVGACPNCWGQDPRCALCRGRGRPGFLPIEQDAFRIYILPAVRRLRTERTLDRPSSSRLSPLERSQA